MASQGVIRRVSFCPHCGNKAPQQQLYTHHYAIRSYNRVGDLEEVNEDYPWLGSYFVANCETCHDLLLYNIEWEARTPEETFREADLVWPIQNTLDRGVPKTVADCYAAAVKVRRHSADAFAGQVRRALEAICVDQGEVQGHLHRRLMKLTKRGILPDKLSVPALELKHVLNEGAHAGSGRIKDIHVPVLDQLFLLVVDYIYGTTSRLEKLRDILQRYPTRS